MGKESSQIVGRKMGLDDNVCEQNLQAEAGDPPAYFVVIGEEVDDRSESADSLQVIPPECERRAKPEP
jgi:hypothetical protein